jgi:hypothetical protein
MITDFFIHELTCAHCRTAYPRVRVSTRIQDEPGAHGLLVGDPVEFTHEDFWLNHSYLPIKPYDPKGELRLLENWECTTCKTFRWAESVIGADHIFKSIEAVRLDPEVLHRANLIATWYLRLKFESWTGHKLWTDADCTVPRPDWLELVRRHLAETPE